MRAPWAGFVVCGVAFFGTAASALADDDDGPRVLSVDVRHPLAPAMVVAVPVTAPAQAPAFSVLDDNGARPTHVEHLGVTGLDVAVVLDTSADVAPVVVEEQQATARELLLHMGDAGQLGVYTTTSAPPQPLTSDRAASFGALAALHPTGDRHVAARLLGALADFRPDPGARRAMIVMSAGGEDGTSPAERTLLGDELAAGDVQVFWLAMQGSAPPIVGDLIAAGQPVTLIEGQSAVVAADHVAAALRSQYRVTVDLAEAVGPARLRVELAGAVYEVPVDLAAAPPVPLATGPPVTVPPTTGASAMRPPGAHSLPAPVATTAQPPATSASVAAPVASAPRPQRLGIIELGDGTHPTWWVLAFFVVIAAATTLVVVIASTLSAATRGARAGAPPGAPNRATRRLRLAVERADPTEGGQ